MKLLATHRCVRVELEVRTLDRRPLSLGWLLVGEGTGWFRYFQTQGPTKKKKIESEMSHLEN